MNVLYHDIKKKFLEALEDYVIAVDEITGYDVPLDKLQRIVNEDIFIYFRFLEDKKKNPELYGDDK